MAPFQSSRRRALARDALLGTLAGASLILAGCKGDEGVITGTIYPDDYRVRHAIALVNAPTTLDLFVGRNMAGLDARQNAEIRAFAEEYRRQGRGPMSMQVPADTAHPAATHRGAQAIRAALAAAGVGPAYLHVSTYPGAQDMIASAVRLQFSKLQAKVTDKCGDWTQDIGRIAASTETWQNKPFRNYGCAYQTMIANQVADPIDLVRGRAEDRSDVVRRMKVFENARNGQDPGTTWGGGQATIKGGGGG